MHLKWNYHSQFLNYHSTNRCLFQVFLIPFLEWDPRVEALEKLLWWVWGFLWVFLLFSSLSGLRLILRGWDMFCTNLLCTHLFFWCWSRHPGRGGSKECSETPIVLQWPLGLSKMHCGIPDGLETTCVPFPEQSSAFSSIPSPSFSLSFFTLPSLSLLETLFLLPVWSCSGTEWS